MKIEFTPIGIIQTPFKTKEGMPIQSKGAEGIQGTILLNEEYAPGLKDLDGFSHIILVYFFDKSVGYDLLTKPFLDKTEHGVFATRAPKRPNAIGLSVVKLLAIETNILKIENVDILDGTPLLDIKPYVPDFDIHNITKSGWTNNRIHNLNETKSDKRFA